MSQDMHRVGDMLAQATRKIADTTASHLETLHAQNTLADARDACRMLADVNRRRVDTYRTRGDTISAQAFESIAKKHDRTADALQKMLDTYPLD